VEDGQALEVAVRAARAGGEVALAHLGKLDYLRWKSHRDVVSGTTLKVQEAILDLRCLRRVEGSDGHPSARLDCEHARGQR